MELVEGYGDGASQRKSERYRVNWPSRILLPNKAIVAVRTRDVSAGGIGFEMAQRLPDGTEVSIELSPCAGGKQYVLRAKCQIMYSMLLANGEGFSHGAKFSMIADDQLQTLKGILKRLSA